MSGGGYPPGPFGTDPFGGGWPPVGGWPPGGPMPPQQPPPTEQTNTLATLSVVFAVVFAPVGAVLGHLALSEIKKRPQRGHTRALVGVTLSYVLIVIAVLGLVVWAVLPARTSTSSTTDNSSTIAPTTTTTKRTPPPTIGESVKLALLDGPELAKALGDTFNTEPLVPLASGGIDAMPDGLSSDAKASPHDCVGVVAVAQKSVYQSAGVRSFASEQWSPSYAYSRVLGVEEAVVAVSTAADAQALLARFSEQWAHCNGQKVTVLAAGAPHGGNFTDQITDVRVVDSVVAATVQWGDTVGGPTRPVARAIAVQGNCIAEAAVTFIEHPEEFGKGSTNPNSSGIDVVRAIMDKIRKLS